MAFGDIPGHDRPVAFEQWLRDLVSNIRLVGELPIDGQVFESAKKIVESSVSDKQSVERLSRVSPATLCVYLVGVGRALTSGGSFWPQVPFANADTGMQSVAGTGFEDALASLELETFYELVRDESALRYVAPILLHGGLPRYCLGDVLRSLVAEMRFGSLDPLDIVSSWRSDDTALQKLDAPARRFLQRGGKIAVDLIGRMIDLINHGGGQDAASDVRLPAYYVEELRKIESEQRTVVSRHVPRPFVWFDPFTPEGPIVELPATSDVEEWVISSDLRQRRVEAQSFDSDHLELRPASEWRFEGRLGESVLMKMVSRRNDAGLYLFDSRWRLSKEQQEVPADEDFVVLFPVGTVFRADEPSGRVVQPRETYPQLGRKWSGYEAALFNFSDCNLVFVAGQELPAIRVEHDVRPSLFAGPTPGVLSAGGLPVFDALPQLHFPSVGADAIGWRVILKHEGISVERSLSQLSETLPGTFSLAGLFAAPVCGQFELTVRGPLGSDLREDFVVVEDLVVRRPTTLVGPNETAFCEVAANPALRLQPNGTTELVAGRSRFDIKVSRTTNETQLISWIPRLRWSFSSSARGEGVLATKRVDLSVEDFRADDLGLTVRCGIETRMSAEMRSPDGQVLYTLPAASFPDRWRFDLDKMSETVRQSSITHLTLWLLADGIEEPAVEIRRSYIPQIVRVDCTRDPDHTLLVLDIEESWTPGDRIVRLWSVESPWQLPTDYAVSQSGKTLASVLEQSIPAGPYLCELTVSDAEPVFPSVDLLNTSIVFVPEHVLETGSDESSKNSIEAHNDELNRLLTAGPIVALPEDSPRIVRQAVTLIHRSLVLGSDSANQRRIDRALEVAFLDPDEFGRTVTAQVFETNDPGRHANELAITAVTSAVDCRADGLSELELADLWETNVALATAFDRPHPEDRESRKRWAAYLGWDPTTGLSVGRAFGTKSWNLPLHLLVDLETKARAESPKLLSPKWFNVCANVATQVARREEERVSEWQLRHRRLTSSSDVRRHGLWNSTLDRMCADPAFAGLRIPQDITALALHLIGWGDEAKADASREALFEALDLFPELVERQLIVAMVLHLDAEDMWPFPLSTTE